MHPIPPLILLSIGALFFYFLIAVNSPTHPIPKVLLTARVHFPELKQKFADRVVGFALVDEGKYAHVGWMANKDEKGAESALLQHYIVPIEPNTTTLEAVPIEERELDGTITHIAFNRLRKPAPCLGMVNRRVVGEELSYHVDMTSIDPSLSPDHPDRLSTWSYTLPGSLHVSRASMSASGNLIASRRYDQSLFRIYKAPQCGNGIPCVAPAGIAGPDLSSSLERHLLAVELFKTEDGPMSIFSVTYAEAEDYYRVSMCIHSLIDGEWVQDELWKRPYIHYQRNVYSPVVGHDVLEAENVDQLSWLTTPVVASSSTAKTLAWIFLGRIFTLDYVNATVSGKTHGYILDDTTTVTDLNSADLRLKGANLNDDGTVLAVVNESDDIITFERPLTASVPDTDSEPWFWDDFFAISHEVGFFFDGSLESTPMTREHDDVASYRRPAWHLKNVWLNEVDAMAGGQVVVAFNLINGTDLVAGNISKSISPGSYILILYSNNVLNLLDLQHTYEGSHVKRFFKARWPMLSAMAGVVAMFVGNELRGGLSQYHAVFVAGLGFWILCCVMMTVDP
ncbi:hypothetical protein DFJ77DRAFT_514290 [Powellomyces hirtus]|nr:hypothetical protein DFJ77DRAFT_514290 [Powellomyces hirtus]